MKITSDVQTGEITSAATATVDKADDPAAPSAFTLSFTLNSDGTTFTATIPAFEGGEYSFGFGTDALTKYTDSEPFTLKASGNAEGSTVRYESSAPEVAGVDENGLVTIEKDKFSALEDLKVS